MPASIHENDATDDNDRIPLVTKSSSQNGHKTMRRVVSKRPPPSKNKWCRKRRPKVVLFTTLVILLLVVVLGIALMGSKEQSSTSVDPLASVVIKEPPDKRIYPSGDSLDTPSNSNINPETKPQEYFCGGIAGRLCPTGMYCCYNPNNNCKARENCFDCGGICVPSVDDPPPSSGIPEKIQPPPYNGQSTNSVPPPSHPQCGRPTDPCMNEQNYQQCLDLVERDGCQQLLTMESCPLQFGCGDDQGPMQGNDPIDTETTTTSSSSVASAWPATSPSGSSSVSEPTTNTVVPIEDASSYYSTHQMMERLRMARESYTEQLKRDYGSDAYEAMFVRGSETVHVLSESQMSYQRLNRKLKIKLVRLQIQAEERQRNDRYLRTRSLEGDMYSSIENSGDSTLSLPFVWATGGHSAAAGHGNLYNESYTAVLEQSLQPIFAATGLDFVGRNYAMGGMASGAEIAFCMEAIFGVDIDVVTWDFGMTDSTNVALLELYCRRAGIHKNRPACIGVRVDGRTMADRIEALDDLEEIGLTTMYTYEDSLQSVVDAIPDSFGKSTEQLQEMAPYVKFLKCEGKIEKGDPYCGAKKFSSDVCADRKFRTSWHPGWKWHALMGHLLALSMIDSLTDALTELASLSSTPRKDILGSLIEEEDGDYLNYYQGSLGKRVPRLIPETGSDGLDLDLVFKGRSVCHTALLPAETRFRGILTESTQIGFTSYDKGIGRRKADASPNDSDLARLVYDVDARQQCPVELNVDYKDYFFVRFEEGRKKIVLPNDTERKIYGGSSPLSGVVGISLATCSWGNCLAEDVREDSILSRLVMNVNGVEVTSTLVVAGTMFLRHEDGFQFPANEDGRFEINIQVTERRNYLRVTSAIVW